MEEALSRLDEDLRAIDAAALASAEPTVLAAACAHVATAALESARRSQDALDWARAALHFCGGTRMILLTNLNIL